MGKLKRLAAVLAVLLAFVMLLSVLFIALEADHCCCGDDCAICAQLSVCENLLQNLLPLAVLLTVAHSLCAPVRSAADGVLRFAGPHTLIVLKVKLSD